MSECPAIKAEEVSPAEFAFYEFMTKFMERHCSEHCLTIQQDNIAPNGKKYNRYILTRDHQSLTVDFRVFAVGEMPPVIRRAVIRSPGHRAMIGTFRTMGMDHMVESALIFLNETISLKYSKSTHVYYALQEKVKNLHAFFYSEGDTENKVVVLLQL